MPSLHKDLIRTLGSAPDSAADYEAALLPQNVAQGWGRGDIGQHCHTDAWTLFCFGDTYIYEDVDDLHALVRSNTFVLIEGTSVSWVTGDFVGFHGAVALAHGTGGRWYWPTGVVTSSSTSAFVVSAEMQTGTPYSLVAIAMHELTSLTSSTPVASSAVATDINVTGVQWLGTPFRLGGHLYLYGINSTWEHIVARHTWSTTLADYATGWTYWTGSGWSTTFASRAGVTIQSAPLRALSVIPWDGGFLASAKALDAAPEGGYADEWPQVLAWWSESVTGPWVRVGEAAKNIASVIGTNWYAYNGSYQALPNCNHLVAQWSTNLSNADPDFSTADYGAHFATAKGPLIGPTPRRIGVGGQGTTRWVDDRLLQNGNLDALLLKAGGTLLRKEG